MTLRDNLLAHLAICIPLISLWFIHCMRCQCYRVRASLSVAQRLYFLLDLRATLFPHLAICVYSVSLWFMHLILCLCYWAWASLKGTWWMWFPLTVRDKTPLSQCDLILVTLLSTRAAFLSAPSMDESVPIVICPVPCLSRAYNTDDQLALLHRTVCLSLLQQILAHQNFSRVSTTYLLRHFRASPSWLRLLRQLNRCHKRLHTLNLELTQHHPFIETRTSPHTQPLSSGPPDPNSQPTPSNPSQRSQTQSELLRQSSLPASALVNGLYQYLAMLIITKNKKPNRPLLPLLSDIFTVSLSTFAVWLPKNGNLFRISTRISFRLSTLSSWLNINWALNFDLMRLSEVDGIFMLSLVRLRICPERDTAVSDTGADLRSWLVIETILC